MFCISNFSQNSEDCASFQDTASYSYALSFGRECAHEIVQERRESAQTYITVNKENGVRRIKTYCDGSFLSTVVLSDYFEVESVFIWREQTFFTLKITSKYRLDKHLFNIDSHYIACDTLNDYEETIDLVNQFFHVVDTKIYRKEFISNFQNLVYNLLKEKRPEKADFFGWQPDNSFFEKFDGTVWNRNPIFTKVAVRSNDLSLSENIELLARGINANNSETFSGLLFWSLTSSVKKFYPEEKAPNISIFGGSEGLNFFLSLFSYCDDALLINCNNPTKVSEELLEIFREDIITVYSSGVKPSKINAYIALLNSFSENKGLNFCILGNDLNLNQGIRSVPVLTSGLTFLSEYGIALQTIKLSFIRWISAKLKAKINLTSLLADFEEFCGNTDVSKTLTRSLHQGKLFIQESFEKAKQLPPILFFFFEAVKCKFSNGEISVITFSDLHANVNFQTTIIIKDSEVFLPSAFFSWLLDEYLLTSCRSELRENLINYNLIRRYEGSRDMFCDLCIPGSKIKKSGLFFQMTEFNKYVGLQIPPKSVHKKIIFENIHSIRKDHNPSKTIVNITRK